MKNYWKKKKNLTENCLNMFFQRTFWEVSKDTSSLCFICLNNNRKQKTTRLRFYMRFHTKPTRFRMMWTKTGYKIWERYQMSLTLLLLVIFFSPYLRYKFKRLNVICRWHISFLKYDCCLRMDFYRMSPTFKL